MGDRIIPCKKRCYSAVNGALQSEENCAILYKKRGETVARLTDPITMLKGIGPSKAKQFANLNIYTLGDLICHFPRGYEDRTKLVPIEKLEPDVPACFKAMVMNTPKTAHIRKGLDITRVQVADTTGRLNLTFFNSKYVSDQLQYGREYIFYGAVSGDFIG